MENKLVSKAFTPILFLFMIQPMIIYWITSDSGFFSTEYPSYLLGLLPLLFLFFLKLKRVKFKRNYGVNLLLVLVVLFNLTIYLFNKDSIVVVHLIKTYFFFVPIIILIGSFKFDN